MIVDVGPLLRGEVKRMDIDYLLSPEQMDGVTFDADARASEIFSEIQRSTTASSESGLR